MRWLLVGLLLLPIGARAQGFDQQVNNGASTMIETVGTWSAALKNLNAQNAALTKQVSDLQAQVKALEPKPEASKK